MKDDLYFIRTPLGLVKIGRSSDAKARFRVLQSGSPHYMQMLGVVPTAGWQERLWHAAFPVQRFRGEWFKLEGDLPAAIDLALKGEDWTEALQPEPECAEWDAAVFPEVTNPRQAYFHDLVDQRASW